MKRCLSSRWCSLAPGRARGLKRAPEHPGSSFNRRVPGFCTPDPGPFWAGLIIDFQRSGCVHLRRAQKHREGQTRSNRRASPDPSTRYPSPRLGCAGTEGLPAASVMSFVLTVLRWCWQGARLSPGSSLLFFCRFDASRC